jgi:glycosyltransferase involved in cell wall biosynthesis
MARALRYQLAERFDEAADAYAAVLAMAPLTHDALHMLGAIEMRRGNVKEAKRLIVAAMGLRPSYPAIELNLQLVLDAERREEQPPPVQKRPCIELCERALPILVDLALRGRDPNACGQRATLTGSADSGGGVHLIHAARDTEADPSWLARRLAAILSPESPHIWVDRRQAPGVAGGSARRIDSDLEYFPRGGCHIFVGIDIDCTEWVGRAQAERVVVICQPAPQFDFLDRLRAIGCDGARPIELVFPSRAMAARFGPGHAVLPPPVELRADPPALSRDQNTARSRLAGVKVGVIGNNWCGRPLAEEAQFLTQVVASAGNLELYDAGLLRFHLGGKASVRFHARHDAGLEAFLDALDCLLICPEPWWLEGTGRELLTAMASAVPVICPAGSIYAEYINHGADGLLYGTCEEALQQLVDLRRAPARIGRLARGAYAKVADLADPVAAADRLRQLVTGNAFAPEAYPEPSLRAITS